MDKIKMDLYSKMINAEYEYYQYLREKELPIFKENTKNYMFNETHYMYKYYFPQKNINTDNIEVAESTDNQKDSHQKELYHKLCLICHPDKCKESWAENIFKLVQESYESNKMIILEKIYDYYIDNGTLENFDSTVTEKEKFINCCKHELWYLWITNDQMLKEILIPVEKYKEILKEKNKELRAENEKLKKIKKELLDAHEKHQSNFV